MTLLSVLVNNHFGVLTRVTGLFSRRGFNITGLSVGETDDPAVSRVTIQTETGDTEQMCRQLRKLEDVRSAEVLPEDGAVARELVLAKIRGAAPEGFRCETAREGKETRILSFIGDPERVAAFLEALEGSDVVELCRTGVTAMSSLPYAQSKERDL